MNVRLLALCVAAGIAPPAWAQAPASAPNKGEAEVVTHEAPVTFSSRVNLVSVPVVIRDRDGHAVGGLRQEDFQLFDKSKPQAITRFTIQTSTSAAGPVTTSAPVSTSTDTATATPGPKPELPDRYVAYFFDDIHMQPGDLLQARQAANHHLDTALDPRARAGIFTTSGRTTQDFTNDLTKLHAAVNRIQPWTSVQDKGECLQISYFMADYMIDQEVSLTPFGINPSSTLAHAMLDEANGCLHNPPPQPGAGQASGSAQTDPAQGASAASATAGQSLPLRYLWQVANTALQYGAEETSSGMAVLKDLITKMSAAPGSRTIILVSPGFILTKDHRSGENTILDSAIRASVIVNSLDIRGVHTPLRTHTFDAEYGGNFGGANTPESGQARTNAERDEIFQSGNILAELAYGTGGTVHNDNDFEGGLKELAGRPEVVYVLGYSPDNLELDGTYHGLKVKLKEPAKFDGAKFDVEARRGYWAPSHAVEPAETAREELKETLFSRDEIADIPLDVHAEFFKPTGAKAEIRVVARLDAKALKFRKADERNNDTVTVVTGLFDQNGNYISGIERVVELRLRDRSLEALEGSGISVAQSFSVPPGRYIVRVVVTDSEGHTTAARNTGIEAP